MKNVPKLLGRVRSEKPVIHHLTNWVTIYDCANIVKVFGASPVMAHAREEAADMAGIASALVLNIGTLTTDLVEAMKIAAQSANRKGIPVILDVCGAGATRLRDEKSFELIRETGISVIKGNSSEIARIAGENVRTKGVDSTTVTQNMVEIARDLARQKRCTVVVTGKEDIATDDKSTYIIKNGVSLMADIVGTGCMAASVIGTFAAVEPDLPFAAAAGLSCFEIAAELASRSAKGPGTFKEKLFDCAYALDPDTVAKMSRVEVVDDAAAGMRPDIRQRINRE